MVRKSRRNSPPSILGMERECARRLFQEINESVQASVYPPLLFWIFNLFLLMLRTIRFLSINIKNGIWNPTTLFVIK